MKTTPLRLSLLDYLGYRTGCLCLSDLHRPEQARRARLCEIIQALTPGDASLREWNDALAYLSGHGPISTPEAALVDWLRGEEIG